MSRTIRTIPESVANYIGEYESIAAKFGVSIATRNARRAVKGRDGGASFFNMIDSGGGCMHSNKPFTKKLSNKRLRQFEKMDLRDRVLNDIEDFVDYYDYDRDYDYVDDDYYSDEWRLLNENGGDYTGRDMFSDIQHDDDYDPYDDYGYFDDFNDYYSYDYYRNRERDDRWNESDDNYTRRLLEQDYENYLREEKFYDQYIIEIIFTRSVKKRLRWTPKTVYWSYEADTTNDGE